MSAWTDFQIDRLRYLAFLGKSAAEIATEVGRSRNAVIGKADRSSIHLAAKTNALKLAGVKRGRLTAIQPAGHKGDAVTWSCQCDCGKLHVVVASQLNIGRVKSCGCSRRKRSLERAGQISGEDPSPLNGGGQ